MKSIFFRTTALWLGLAFATSSCTKTPQSGSIHQPESFYSSATINGVQVAFTENQNGFVNGYGKAGVWVAGMGQYFERQSTTYAKNGENVFTIHFMKFVTGNPPSKDDIKSIFHEGSYPFGSSDFYNLVDGVEISYIDENGMEWTTKGDQTASTFEVNAQDKNETDSYTPYTTAGTFACKLYNNAGESKTVTNGQFKGRTVVYY